MDQHGGLRHVLRSISSPTQLFRPFRGIGVALLLLAPIAAGSQSAPGAVLPLTRAEATQFEETSRYADVMAFLRTVCASSANLHLTQFGYSSEGRALPLVVVGADPDPESVRLSGKVRVYLQANIHGGEVCGKEALLLLLRALATGQHAAWTDSLVLLIAPIYNADGNERLVLGRAGQYGPFGGNGQRSTAQGYDLNRDHVKLDSPEARSLIRLLRRFDPHVWVDFHTTNGTYHAYHLTYSPPLHPNTYSPIDEFLRGQLLPAVTENVLRKHAWDYYYYGNLPPPHAGNLSWVGLSEDAGWYTFDHRPRYSNSYAGLRNRLGILSEAYSYATFEERILASLYFAEEILDFAHARATSIRDLLSRADSHSVVGEELALRATHQRSESPVEILLSTVTEERNPYTGAKVFLRTGERQPVKVYEYGRFSATESESAPRAYFVPPHLAPALDLLSWHGITSRPVTPAPLRLERFRIDSTAVGEAAYEGHVQVELFGEYESAEVVLPEGTLEVPLDQPLGRFAFTLLEPRSDDGLVNWGLLGPHLEGQPYYPILRLPAAGRSDPSR